MQSVTPNLKLFSDTKGNAKMKVYYNVEADSSVYECELDSLELARAHLVILNHKYNRDYSPRDDDYLNFKIVKITHEIVE